MEREAGDMSTLQIRVDDDPDPATDQFGPWQRLELEINGYEHDRDSVFTSACKFDPTDDFLAPGFGEIQDETTCAPQGGGQFGSLAFGDPTFLSYLETPSAPGGFNINENDDGWWVDDIRFSGLLEEQIHLLPDGGNDVASPADVRCGTNLIAETRAEGDDLQSLVLGSSCADSGDIVVLPGGNGIINSVGSQSRPVDPDDFCGQALARINGRGNPFAIRVSPGEPVLLDGSLSILDACAGGAALYEFTLCDTLEPGGPCEPGLPGAGGTLLQGFSLDPSVQLVPATPASRYQLRVRCSSQPVGGGCEDSVDVRVRVTPTLSSR